MDNVPSYDQVG